MIACEVVDEREGKGWNISFASVPRIGEIIHIERFNRKVSNVYHIADGKYAGKIIVRVNID